ncbi:MAG: TIGR03960 family B12-binding radical SAM protein [Deltaproteobacteria bacterium]|nr:TIGR03960 family B12-binding radical SAM protein [Deltaproteobacteria bacterium]
MEYRSDDYQDFFPWVSKPSQYMGGEINSLRKDPAKVKLTVALAFPDAYEVGMSHLGLRILYHLINQQDEMAAERVFAPLPDMESRLRQSGHPLTSLESRRPLDQFDVIGFSLQYELGYTNLLNMLDLAGIPLRAADRTAKHPLIIAGGPCVFNPGPVAVFFDVMVAGDGEETLLAICQALIAHKHHAVSREDSLKELAKLPGVYVPSIGQPPIKKAIVTDLDAAFFPTSPVVPFGQIVHDRLSLEIARGCARGCRFCQAGYLYRPVRERSPQKILSLARQMLSQTGYQDMTLLSLSAGDYTCLEWLLRHVMNEHAQDNVAISFPSIRADRLTPVLMEEIKRVRKTGFTIAPEAGSDRLRRVINKNLTDEDVIATAKNAFDLGWNLIKLYFMFGLPSETQADLAAIGELARKVAATGRRMRRTQNVNVSLAVFIPKPHTPFQWARQLDLKESLDVIDYFKKHLTGRGINLKWNHPRHSFLEGIFSRGDGRLAPVLETAFASGCRFDAWTEYLRFDLWLDALDKHGIDPQVFLAERPLDAPLSWDIIDPGLDKDFLISEYEKSLRGEQTPDCRGGDCSGCGVCDHSLVEMKIYQPDSVPICENVRPVIPVQVDKPFLVRIHFTKTEDAAFFGHLEMISIFSRALRRAGWNLVHTEGFHPKPKLVFSPALPVGMESLDEHLDVALVEHQDLEAIGERLSQTLPRGLRVTLVAPLPPKRKKTATLIEIEYVVENLTADFETARLDQFLTAESFETTKTSGSDKRSKTIDLKTIITQISPDSPHQITLVLRSPVHDLVRPLPVIKAIFGFDDQQAKGLRMTKIRSVEVNPESV